MLDPELPALLDEMEVNDFDQDFDEDLVTADCYAGHIGKGGLAPDKLCDAWCMKDEAHEGANAKTSPQNWMQKFVCDSRRILGYTGTPVKGRLAALNGFIETIERKRWKNDLWLKDFSSGNINTIAKSFYNGLNAAVRLRKKTGKLDLNTPTIIEPMTGLRMLSATSRMI